MLLYEEHLSKVKNENQFFVHGEMKKFAKDSLGIFDNRQKFRYIVVWIITAKMFETLIISLILFNSFLLGIKDYTDVNDETAINQFQIQIEPLFMYAFLFECIAKIIGSGLFLGKNAYLSDAWNWLDFTVVVSSLMENIPAMSNLSGLRTFRLFRPLRSLTTMPSMKLLINTLFASVTQLGGIMGLAMFFFMIFAILGVSQWTGRIYFRCYQTEWPDENGVWNLVKEDELLCHPSARQCPVGFCNSRYEAFVGNYNITEESISHDADIESLNYGLINFNNIFYAFLTIFQCITMEGWTKIMNIYVDTYSPWFVNLYFILCILICSFFLLNLTIAVMLMKYEELDKSTSNSKHNQDLRQLGLEIMPLQPELIKFLINTDSIQIQREALSLLRTEDSFWKQLFAKKNRRTFDERDRYHQIPIVVFCYNILMNQFFDAFIIFIIVLNTIALSLDKYPAQNDDVLDILSYLNLVFTIIFSIEAGLKLIGLGLKEFNKERFNQFDLAVVIISIAEMYIPGNISGFSCFRAFRLFKILRLFRVGDLRILLDSIQFTLTTIGDYVILLLLFIYVFALIGMSFFAGKINFDEDYKCVPRGDPTGVPTRKSFDGLGDAILTIFQVLLGEGWNDIMYESMRCVSKLWSIYFIGLIIFGNIIMLNLFLAILLGNFDKARNYGQKKKVFEAFREIMEKKENKDDEIPLLKALDLILGDMSKHVKIKVLGIDAGAVKKSHNEGETMIAQSLMEEKVKFMKDDGDMDSLNNNMVSKQIITQHELINPDNIMSPKSQLSEMNLTSPKENKESNYSKSSKREKEENLGSSKRNLTQIEADRAIERVNSQFYQKRQISKQLDQLDKEKRNKSKSKSKRKASSNMKSKRYSKTVERLHKPNPNFLRLREFNRQYHIDPFPGLAEILQKINDLDNVASVKTNTKDKKNAFRIMKSPSKDHEQPEETNRSDNSHKPGQLFQQPAMKKNHSTANKVSSDKLEGKQPHQYESQEGENVEDGIRKKDKRILISNIQEDNSKDKKQNILESKSVKVQNQNLSLLKNVGKNEYFKSSSNINKIHKKLIDDSEDMNEEKENVQEANLNKRQKITNYVKNSSLFLFHKDTKIRKFCMQLSETPEVLIALEKQEKEGNLDDYQGGFESDIDNNEEDLVGVVTTLYGRVDNKSSKKQHKLMTKHNKKFEDIVLVLIIVSSIMLAIDNPNNNPNGPAMIVLKYIDVVFTVLFFIEASIKVIAKGCIKNNLGPVRPYLSNAWNQLDGFVVSASVIDLIFIILKIDMQSLQALKALRALRALRPLRVISKDEGMKLVVNALLASIPSMSNVVVVCSLVMLIFAIMGVSIFKGAFYRCEDPPTSLKPIDMNTIITKQDCLDADGDWNNVDANFDNVVIAFLTLFQMMTTEGWTDVMWNSIDSVGVEMQPKKDARIWVILYICSFMIIGSQFIINLFVGVVIDNFNKIKEKEELGSMFVTKEQKSWIEIQKVGQGKKLKIKIDEPKGCQKIFFNMVNHRYFELTITFFIFTNTVVMAMKHHGMPQDLINFSHKANYVFSVVFNLELIFKLIGLRKLYFIERWNNFDMLIVFATDLGLLLDVFDLGSNFSQTATVVRGFRIMRLFKLIRSSVQMRLILDTVGNIMPQVSNVLTLIFLLFFIFACLGINLFSGVMLQDALDEKNNFQTFWTSMIMLMKFSTGEDWNQFMFELALQDQYNGVKCLKSQSYADIVANDGVMMQCGTRLSYVYFIVFVILVSMLIMNLSVAAVIEGLENAKKENMGIVKGDDIEVLIDLWQDYDPTASGWISIQDLVFLLYELPPPLGKRSDVLQLDEEGTQDQGPGGRQQERYLVNEEKKIVMKKVDAIKLLQGLRIKVKTDLGNGRVHFVDVFKGLIKRKLVDMQYDYKLNSNLNKKIRGQWDKKHKENWKQKNYMTAAKAQAAMIITRWARKQLNLQKNTYKKTDKKSKKKQNNQDKGKGAINSASQHKEEAKQQSKKQFDIEQAEIIFKIINQIDDNKTCPKLENDKKYNIKNKFSWMSTGGEKLLNQLDDECTESNDDSSEIDEQINTNQINSNQIQKGDEFTDQLFGPLTQQVINYSSNKIQINIMNMETGDIDINKKQMYALNPDGEAKRDKKSEDNQKVLDFKDGLDKDHIENLSYMPNTKYNAKQTMEFEVQRKQNELAKQARIQENKKLEAMVPRYQRDENMFKQGFSGNTIVMDPEFVDHDDSPREKEDDKQMVKNLMLKELNQNEAMLQVPDQPVTDIIGTKQDDLVNASRAHTQQEKIAEQMIHQAQMIEEEENDKMD